MSQFIQNLFGGNGTGNGGLFSREQQAFATSTWDQAATGIRNAFPAAEAAAQRFAAATAAGQQQQQQQQHQQQQRQQQQQGAASQQRPPPPASLGAVRQLPVVTVTPADLVDPVNRECCVCLEGINLKDKVVRLPCAHVYHPRCIQEWLLERHCTCPVCRYELPTDDNEYEPIRQRRMMHRKPRFARHELERASIKQLKQLLQTTAPKASSSRQRRHPTSFVEKSDLIRHLIDTDRIDLVSTPDPVYYSVSELRGMSIRRLRSVMNDQAGVFFDPTDVIEKEDMVQIFLNSGRLCIVPERPEDEEIAAEVEEEKKENNRLTNHDDDAMITTNDDAMMDIGCADDDKNGESEGKKRPAVVVVSETSTTTAAACANDDNDGSNGCDDGSGRGGGGEVRVETVLHDDEDDDEDYDYDDDDSQRWLPFLRRQREIRDTRSDPELVMEENLSFVLRQHEHEQQHGRGRRRQQQLQGRDNDAAYAAGAPPLFAEDIAVRTNAATAAGAGCASSVAECSGRYCAGQSIVGELNNENDDPPPEAAADNRNAVGPIDPEGRRLEEEEEGDDDDDYDGRSSSSLDGGGSQRRRQENGGPDCAREEGETNAEEEEEEEHDAAMAVCCTNSGDNLPEAAVDAASAECGAAADDTTDNAIAAAAAATGSCASGDHTTTAGDRASSVAAAAAFALGDEEEGASLLSLSQNDDNARREEGEEEENDNAAAAAEAEEAAARRRMQSLSVSQLRSLARELSVDVSGCIERRDVVERLLAAQRERERNGATPPASNSSTSARPSFYPWWHDCGVSDLRAVAALVKVDNDNHHHRRSTNDHSTSSRERLIMALDTAAASRPTVRSYLMALRPIAGLSVPQLRAAARERNVDLSACLEKEEMVQRLAAAIAESSATTASLSRRGGGRVTALPSRR